MGRVSVRVGKVQNPLWVNLNNNIYRPLQRTLQPTASGNLLITPVYVIHNNIHSRLLSVCLCTGTEQTTWQMCSLSSALAALFSRSCCVRLEWCPVQSVQLPYWPGDGDWTVSKYSSQAGPGPHSNSCLSSEFSLNTPVTGCAALIRGKLCSAWLQSAAGVCRLSVEWQQGIQPPVSDVRDTMPRHRQVSSEMLISTWKVYVITSP